MASTSTIDTVVDSENENWLGHPKGLYVLFFTEMWERFSFYGMRALLVLYMTDHLLLRAEQGEQVFGYQTLKSVTAAFLHFFNFPGGLTVQVFSSQLYGSYIAFVYLTPFFGGLLADKILGQNKTVYVGGILMAIGHFLMAVESLFFVALLFLILGNGCFKPNVSTQVGSLYPAGDLRRDRAFTLFYMGINLGAFLSPLVCGTLGQKYGWHWGFAAAGVGMLLGLMVYHFGRKHLPPDEMHKVHTLVDTPNAVNNASTTSPEEIAHEGRRIWALVFLGLVSAIFWAVYEQQGNTLQLWSDRNTDWTFFGWQMPSTWYQSFNPMFIFLFAPILDLFWGWQSKKNQEPTSVTKMGIGCTLLGLAFVIMIASLKSLATGKVSPLWLILSTAILTIGELYLSPIGLSLVTKIAPARMVSMMMGIWFLANFIGNYLSGWIGGYYEIMTKEAFFGLLLSMGIGAGLIFFAARRPLEKMMGDR